MSSLKTQYISETYTRLIHNRSGEALPETGKGVFYDGLGREASINIGRKGQGIAVKGNLRVGNLTFPQTGNGVEHGSIMVHLSANKIDFKKNETIISEIVDLIHPVGSIIMTVTSENPSTRFANTTWERIAKGEAIVGVGGSEFEIGSNGFPWSKGVELPKHYHGIGRFLGRDTGGSREIDDNAVFITAKGLDLPEEGWNIPDGEDLFVGRRCSGNTGSRGQDWVLKNGYEKDKAMITTTQFAFNSTGDDPEMIVDVTPPSYAVYVWKRTS
jgi:hypothetical protein